MIENKYLFNTSREFIGCLPLNKREKAICKELYKSKIQCEKIT
jgi:hypothetical protein